jgi:hypothetical protein
MYVKKTDKRVRQGDILEDFTYKFTKIFDQPGEIVSITLPYAVVLTQDCDLERDYEKRIANPKRNLSINDDKVLQSVLICPAYIADTFRIGEHLKALGLMMENWNKDRWGYIKTNQNERFHFLDIDADNSMPKLVIDFKHYYTVPTDEIYSIAESKYKLSISNLFREDVSRRFANYLSRIGLPMQSNQELEASTV